jgi:hypothetical protein
LLEQLFFVLSVVAPKDVTQVEAIWFFQNFSVAVLNEEKSK